MRKLGTKYEVKRKWGRPDPNVAHPTPPFFIRFLSTHDSLSCGKFAHGFQSTRKEETSHPVTT